jgi:hypothetical protein
LVLTEIAMLRSSSSSIAKTRSLAKRVNKVI